MRAAAAAPQRQLVVHVVPVVRRQLPVPAAAVLAPQLGSVTDATLTALAAAPQRVWQLRQLPAAAVAVPAVPHSGSVTDAALVCASVAAQRRQLPVAAVAAAILRFAASAALLASCVPWPVLMALQVAAQPCCRLLSA